MTGTSTAESTDDGVRRRPTGRRAGESGTRDAILRAARLLFAEKGYGGASLRAIAAEAGVDPALIRHFFGGKDGLFAATLEFSTDIPHRLQAVLHGDRETVGARLTDMYLQLWEEPQTAHVLEAMLRSAVTTDQAAGMLREFIHARVLHAVVPALGGHDAARRVTVAASHLIGLAIARHVVRVEPLAQMPRAELVAMVGPTIQRYLTGPLPGGGGDGVAAG